MVLNVWNHRYLRSRPTPQLGTTLAANSLAPLWLAMVVHLVSIFLKSNPKLTRASPAIDRGILSVEIYDACNARAHSVMIVPGSAPSNRIASALADSRTVCARLGSAIVASTGLEKYITRTTRR